MSLTEPINHQESHQESHHKSFGTNLETKRWGILISFSLYNAGVAMGWLSYGAINEPSMEYFNIDTNHLLYLSDFVLYMALLFSYLGCYVATKSFRLSIISCATISCIGGWIRYLGGSNYPLALTGQIFIGLATAPSLGIATLLPDRWFSASERHIVTTFSVYSNYIGWAIGYILPPIVVGNDPNKMHLHLFIQAIFLTIPAILCLLLVREKPKVPPSYSAMVKLADHSSFREEIKSLMKIPQFLWSSFFFGMFLGVSFSVSTVSEIFMESLNLSSLDQGLVGFSYVTAGVIAGFLGTLWMSKQTVQNLDPVIKVLLSLSLVSLVALGIIFVTLEQPPMTIILICHCVLGVGMVGILPFFCSSIIESTFPAQESMAINPLYMVGMLFSAVSGHLSTLSIVGKGGFWVMAALIFPCWIYGTFIYKTDYKQQNADAAHKEIEEKISC